jgi:hypothetical protein
MNIRPAQPGRTLQGETPFGDYAIHLYRDHDGPLFDANGEQVGTAMFTIKTPAPPVITVDQVALAKARHDICAKCPAHADLTDTTVTCRRRRPCCRQYNLLDPNLECPEKRWKR